MTPPTSPIRDTGPRRSDTPGLILARWGLVPLPAAHLLSNRHNLTRDQYYGELPEASRTEQTTSFPGYATQGLVDGPHTLSGDLNRLRDIGLVVKRPRGWRSNDIIIAAFLSPMAENEASP
ncbi:MAG: hypothetical protein GY926_27210 [bacterium]|nr:hypothetical protein [bacterium]